MSPELQPMAVQYYCHVSPSVSRDQYTALPLEGVLVTWYGHTSHIYRFWYKFDTVLRQFLETGTSDRCLIGIVKILRFSGFSLYPLSFFLYSPFKVHFFIFSKAFNLPDTNDVMFELGLFNLCQNLMNLSRGLNLPNPVLIECQIKSWKN